MGVKRNWAEAHRKIRREGECRLCGARDQLTAAHIVPRSLGGGMSEFDTVPMCLGCHRAFDAHEIDVMHAITYAEQAEAVRVMGIERVRKRLLPSEYERVAA